MTESVKLRKEDQVAVLLLNRPQGFNAFDLEMIQQVARNLMAVAADPDVQAVVITGEGKAFCAGADLRWGSGFLPDRLAAALHELAAHYHQAIVEIRRMRVPVVAAVNGVAAGAGFSLALACDFRVMARSAILRQAYTSAGLCLDGGGTFTLPRLVGLARALEIAAFDRPISSEQALAWGMATKVAEDGQALEEAIAMARELTKNSLSSFGWSKQLLVDSFDTALETQLEKERAALCACAAHPNGTEGVRAFLEKRKPVFNQK